MLTLRGRFDLVHATNRATSEPLPLIPPARGDFEAELHTAGQEHRAYVSAAAQIVNDQRRLGPFDTNPEGYHIFNFGAGMERALAGRTVNLDVRVHNALDARYTDFLSRYKAFAYEQGRNVVVRLSTGF
jgi:TonB dependent receptor.